MIAAEADSVEVVDARGKPIERQKSKSLRWWLEPAETLHEAVHAVARRIAENMSTRRMRNLDNALMYSDVDPIERYASSGGSEGYGDESRGRVTLNVVQNAVDTAASMVAKNRPKPMFLTDGGDWYQMERADKLTRYLAGVFDDCDVYGKSERVFTDGGIFGTGQIKFGLDEEQGRITAEWVFIGEILVDDVEGMRELPSQLHQRKLVSRDELAETYPDAREEIQRANAANALTGQQTVSDVIQVIESWHLKSGPNAKDGLHTITIETATLFSEPYEKAYYPILFWRWYHSTLGFWGRGICDEIGKIQRTINRLLAVIDESQEKIGVPVIFVDRTASISEDELLCDELGRVIEYTGNPPQFGTPPCVAPELYQHVERLEQKAYNLVGINQSMAQGQKQAGLSSGAAIREATDIASGRFQVVGQRWESFFTEIARVVVDMSRDLAKKKKDLRVRVKDADSVEEIAWKDVNLDADRFKISVFEVSALPTTPQGRLQTITEWGANGWIPPEVMMSLLNIPDLKRWTSLETSTSDLVQKTIARIKESKTMTDRDRPIPQMNLDVAKKIATMERVRASVQELPDDVLDLIDQYIEAIEHVIADQRAAAAPPPQPAPPPQAAPGPGSNVAPPGPQMNLGGQPTPPPSPMAAA